MTTFTLVLPFIPLCEHLLLIFLLVREARRKIYPIIVSNVKLAFPEIARFFNVMEKDLERLYPIVDSAKATTGRPPLCHHFQLRFIIFFFLSGLDSLKDALEHVNTSLEWQDILGMPVKTYHGSTLSRFLKRIGEERFHAIESRLIRLLLKRKLISLKTLVIDGFPLISHLNTQKCLKHFELDIERLSRFFLELDITPVLNFLHYRRYSGITPVTYFRMFVFQLLWGYRSTAHFFKTFEKKPAIKVVITGSDRFPSYNAYLVFVKGLKASTTWPAVKFFLEDVIVKNPAFYPLPPRIRLPEDVEHWHGVMDNHHQLRDTNCRLNYCSSKNMTYYGREAGLVVDAGSELPLFGWVQPGSRIGNAEFHDAMELADEVLPRHIRVRNMIGDGEFDTDANAESCKELLRVKLIRPVEQGKSMNRKLPKLFFLLRLGIERANSRIEGLKGMKRPPVLGDRRVKGYFHWGLIALQLIALYSARIGQRSKFRSIKWIRQKRAV